MRRRRCTRCPKGGVYGLAIAAAVALGTCSLDLDPTPDFVRPIYDLAEGEIPLPSDLLRDEETGLLSLPTDDASLTPAEVELRERMNRMDGWPSTSQVSMEFTGSVAEDTVSESTVQVWRWSDPPVRVTEVTRTLGRAGTELTITPPRAGWLPGQKYVVVLIGGSRGLRGRLNQEVVADASFYFVRLDQPLDDPAHGSAFPGTTREERLQKGQDLEEVRLKLKPYLDHFAQMGIPREEIVALTAFTTTRRPEVAMDEASQRMPLPIDLLIDPVTDRVELPLSPDDSDLRRDAKLQVSGLDGFALSANLLFETTRAMDPLTVTYENVRLYELSNPPELIPVEAWLLPDGIHVVVRPQVSPLKEKTDYAVVVYDGMQSLDGSHLAPMPAGMLLLAEAPVFAQGRSQISSLEDDTARRIESTRAKVAPLLSILDRERIVTAWSFRTQAVVEPLAQTMDAAAREGVFPHPENAVRMSPGEALLDFVIGIASLFNVDEVWHGTIRSPVYLDQVTRGFREDGSYQVEDVAFTLVVPRGVEPGTPLPTVIFGHGLMTERRFVLALGDALAARGFAAIAIDLPYHGTRTHCKRGGPMSVPHPLTGELVDLNPCQSGTTCAEDGRCVDSMGQGNALAMWPIVNYPMASGSAFLEMEALAHTRDHFVQGLIDIQALLRSLREGDWESAVGYPIDKSRFYYVGQSLGGILGGVFTSMTPEVERSVWNVPGCDVVDMFDTSTYFGPQVDAFFQREGINRTGYDAELFLNVARWIMDSVDPHGIAHLVRDSGQAVLIQLAQLDFIIPNWSTRKLQEISGVPLREYLGEHAFLTIPGEPAFFAGVADVADFLDGTLTP